MLSIFCSAVLPAGGDGEANEVLGVAPLGGGEEHVRGGVVAEIEDPLPLRLRRHVDPGRQRRGARRQSLQRRDGQVAAARRAVGGEAEGVRPDLAHRGEGRRPTGATERDDRVARPTREHRRVRRLGADRSLEGVVEHQVGIGRDDLTTTAAADTRRATERRPRPRPPPPAAPPPPAVPPPAPAASPRRHRRQPRRHRRPSVPPVPPVPAVPRGAAGACGARRSALTPASCRAAAPAAPVPAAAGTRRAGARRARCPPHRRYPPCRRHRRSPACWPPRRRPLCRRHRSGGADRAGLARASVALSGERVVVVAAAAQPQGRDQQPSLRKPSLQNRHSALMPASRVLT